MSNLDQQIEDLKRRLAQPASKLNLIEPLDSPDPYSSWFGKVTLEPEGSQWPDSLNGPMLPLCQLIVEHAPFVPESIQDIRVLQIFIDPEFYDCDTDNGKGWHVRTITDVSRLVPVLRNNKQGDIKAMQATWELIEKDYPVWDDVPIDTPFDLVTRWSETTNAENGTKLGGWPSLIQSEISWGPWNKHPINPEYVFQIDSEEKSSWMWGDAGAAYFGRGTGDHRESWAMSWQCF